jgi:uncharacterized membrane protein YoaK (UPF0700 family)
VTYRPDTVTQTNSLPPASVSTHATARVGVLLGLTVVTGVVDAVSFLGLGHIFTANMTGNVVFLGLALGGGLDVSAWRSATALVAFALGSVYGGWLANRPGRDPAQPLAIAMRLESLLLALAAIAALLVNGAASAAVYPVIVLTAVAMGLRNAVMRRAGVPDLATTVLTSTITAWMADSPIVGGTGEGHTRRTLSIVAMCGGAAFGAQLLHRFGIAASLIVAALLVLGLAIIERLMSRQTARPPASDRRQSSRAADQ